MAYNLTNLTAASGGYEYAHELNNVLNGSPAIGILVVVFLVSMGYFANEEGSKMMIASGFITTVVALILLFMEFISMYVFFSPVVIMLAGLAIKFFSGN